MVDGQQHHGFHQLRLDHRSAHRDNRLAREDRRPLRNGPHVTAEVEVAQIIEEGVAHALLFQQRKVRFAEGQILKIVDQLPDTGHDGKAAVVRHMAEKHVEPRDLVAHAVFKIAVCHGQFVKVRQHGQIPFLQCVAQGNHSSFCCSRTAAKFQIYYTRFGGEREVFFKNICAFFPILILSAV